MNVNLPERAKAFVALKRLPEPLTWRRGGVPPTALPRPHLVLFTSLDPPLDEPRTRQRLQMSWHHLSWPLDSFQ